MAKVFLEVRRRRRGKKKKKKKVEAPLAIRSGASYESRTTNEAIINHKRAGSLGRPYIYLKKKRKEKRLYLRDYGQSRSSFYHIPG